MWQKTGKKEYLILINKNFMEEGENTLFFAIYVKVPE